jgi:hypothetical protein
VRPATPRRAQLVDFCTGLLRADRAEGDALTLATVYGSDSRLTARDHHDPVTFDHPVRRDATACVFVTSQMGVARALERDNS